MRLALRRLADARGLILHPEPGEVLSAPPFHGESTIYQVHTDRRDSWASYIWETLGIPAALGIDANLSAACPDCHELMSVKVEDGRCHGAEAYVFHFLVPAAQFWQNIVFTCANQLLYRSKEHVERWSEQSGYELGYVGTLQQARQLAAEWYGDRLQPGFRRRTIGEAQVL